MTVRSLAGELYLSTASIIRFTQKLGYGGFTDFKMQLLEEMKTDAMPQEQAGGITKRDSIASIVNGLASIEKKILTTPETTCPTSSFPGWWPALSSASMWISTPRT